MHVMQLRRQKWVGAAFIGPAVLAALALWGASGCTQPCKGMSCGQGDAGHGTHDGGLADGDTADAGADDTGAPDGGELDGGNVDGGELDGRDIDGGDLFGPCSAVAHDPVLGTARLASGFRLVGSVELAQAWATGVVPGARGPEVFAISSAGHVHALGAWPALDAPADANRIYDELVPADRARQLISTLGPEGSALTCWPVTARRRPETSMTSGWRCSTPPHLTPACSTWTRRGTSRSARWGRTSWWARAASARSPPPAASTH